MVNTPKVGPCKRKQYTPLNVYIEKTPQSANVEKSMYPIISENVVFKNHSTS